MTVIDARARPVDNHWSVEAVLDARTVVVHARRLDHVEVLVKRAFEAEGVDVRGSTVRVTRVKKRHLPARPPLMVAADGSGGRDDRGPRDDSSPAWLTGGT